MNRQSSLGFLFLLSALVTTSCIKLSPEQAHFAKGFDAYNKGDFTTAVLYLKPLVEAGNPAAELLMAKMYSNGQGVSADIGKSEFLRNSATLQIFQKKNITPGEMNPMGTSLASISKRLDYYMNVSEGKEAPVKDLSEIVQSLDIGNVAELQSRDPDQGEAAVAHSSSESGIVLDSSRDASETLEPVHSSVVNGDSADLSPAMPPIESSRGSDPISLTVLHQAAENGDPMAMEFLAAAYAHGFYGLKPNPGRSLFWANQSRKVRQRAPSRNDSSDKLPVVPLVLIVGIGLSLIGGGIWLWQANVSR